LTVTFCHDILKISIYGYLKMKTAAAQIAFRYRPKDSTTGVTRTTTKRLADVLGVDETQVIHLALHELATKFLPQYEADEGALTKTQINQVKKSAPKPKGGTLRSSLFEMES
jgi:hypothetical protein